MEIHVCTSWTWRQQCNTRSKVTHSGSTTKQSRNYSLMLTGTSILNPAHWVSGFSLQPVRVRSSLGPPQFTYSKTFICWGFMLDCGLIQLTPPIIKTACVHTVTSSSSSNRGQVTETLTDFPDSYGSGPSGSNWVLLSWMVQLHRAQCYWLPTTDQIWTTIRWSGCTCLCADDKKY